MVAQAVIFYLLALFCQVLVVIEWCADNLSNIGTKIHIQYL